MTRTFRGKTYWIVGASEGLGRAIAAALAAEGADLILSSRNRDRLAALARDLGTGRALPMDVTDSASVRQAIDEAGPVDGVIFSAGLYDPMTAAAWDTEAALRMCDANFLGAMRLLGGVVPAMIARGQGHVVLIGSLAGYRGLPGAIGYGASKAALMHLAECLRGETLGTGVTVQLANPGFIRTRLTAKNTFHMPSLMTPEAAASQVLRLMRGGRFRRDFPRPFAWLFTLGRFLPERLFYRLFRG